MLMGIKTKQKKDFFLEIKRACLFFKQLNHNSISRTKKIGILKQSFMLNRHNLSYRINQP